MAKRKAGKNWTTSLDVLRSIEDSYNRLVSGDASVEQTSAEARVLGCATKMLSIKLEHAKLTDRLRGKSLPGFKL